jgi:hypothetical protein
MKEPTRLPTRAELQELLEILRPPEEEMDDVSASIIVERAGVDRAQFSARLRVRLEKRAADFRDRGEEVPQALADTLKALEPKTVDDDVTALSPKEMIDGLLGGYLPGNAMETNRAAPMHVFRSRGVELTEEDIRILEEISLELQSRAGEQEE